MRALSVWVACLALAGCGDKGGKGESAEGGAQSFSAAMKHVCQAPVAIKDKLATADPADKQRLLAEHISSGLTNPKAIEMFKKLATVAPSDRALSMEAALKEAGIQKGDCPMLSTVSP